MSSSVAAPSSYVPYSASVEVIPDNEHEVIDQILQSMHRLSDRNQKKQNGHAVRVSHAKSHGFAAGTLEVLDGLPEELRQGLFAVPKRYDVMARLANVPGEIVSDAISTQRGLSFKVLGVDGEKLPGHAGDTQDFVMDTGSRFGAKDAKEFLATQLVLEHGPQIPDGLKEAVSKVSFAANKALHAIGKDSAHLDLYGSPRIHPLAEAYYTQVAIRYGDYVAKLVAVPTTPDQLALENDVLDTAKDPDALRTATVSYLRDHDAVFDIRIQLCTDLEKMPVEDGTAEWSEDESPYQTVARLTLPRQEAYSDARRAYGDDRLSFSPAHSLAAHRPLGSIMRARLRAYPEMSRHRRSQNGEPLTEPKSVDEMPA